MGPRTLRTDLTRKRILGVAHQLFAENGFHGTSVRRIAGGAGVSLGNLYNYFPGKEALFAAVLSEFHPYHQILPALQEAQGETLEAFVRDAARHVVSHLASHPDFLNLMFIELVEFEGRHMPGLLETILPRVLQTLQPFIHPDQAVAAPSHSGIRQVRKIPGPLFFRAFIGLFVSYYITGKFLSGPASGGQAQNDLQSFVDIFLYGVLQPEVD